MGLSIKWLLEFIDGDAKEETEEYDCRETTWGVFKAYAFFFIWIECAHCASLSSYERVYVIIGYQEMPRQRRKFFGENVFDAYPWLLNFF